eukprot:gene333-1711_t
MSDDGFPTLVGKAAHISPAPPLASGKAPPGRPPPAKQAEINTKMLERERAAVLALGIQQLETQLFIDRLEGNSGGPTHGGPAHPQAPLNGQPPPMANPNQHGWQPSPPAHGQYDQQYSRQQQRPGLEDPKPLHIRNRMSPSPSRPMGGPDPDLGPLYHPFDPPQPSPRSYAQAAASPMGRPPGGGFGAEQNRGGRDGQRGGGGEDGAGHPVEGNYNDDTYNDREDRGWGLNDTFPDSPRGFYPGMVFGLPQNDTLLPRQEGFAHCPPGQRGGRGGPGPPGPQNRDENPPPGRRGGRGGQLPRGPARQDGGLLSNDPYRQGGQYEHYDAGYRGGQGGAKDNHGQQDRHPAGDNRSGGALEYDGQYSGYNAPPQGPEDNYHQHERGQGPPYPQWERAGGAGPPPGIAMEPPLDPKEEQRRAKQVAAKNARKAAEKEAQRVENQQLERQWADQNQAATKGGSGYPLRNPPGPAMANMPGARPKLYTNEPPVGGPPPGHYTDGEPYAHRDQQYPPQFAPPPGGPGQNPYACPPLDSYGHGHSQLTVEVPNHSGFSGEGGLAPPKYASDLRAGPTDEQRSAAEVAKQKLQDDLRDQIREKKEREAREKAVEAEAAKKEEEEFNAYFKKQDEQRAAEVAAQKARGGASEDPGGAQPPSGPGEADPPPARAARRQAKNVIDAPWLDALVNGEGGPAQGGPAPVGANQHQLQQDETAPGFSEARERRSMLNVKRYWHQSSVTGASQVLLAPVKSYWRQSSVTGDSQALLALVKRYWRQSRVTGASLTLLAPVKSYWRQSSVTGTSQALLALVKCY